MSSSFQLLGDLTKPTPQYTMAQGRIIGLAILARMRHRATLDNDCKVEDWQAIKNVEEQLRTLLQEGEAYEAILVGPST